VQCSAVQCSAVPFGTAPEFDLQKYHPPWRRASESAKPVSLQVTSHAATYVDSILCQTGHIEVENLTPTVYHFWFSALSYVLYEI
jgi:hypothetical protein